MPALEANAERYRSLEQDPRLLTRPGSDLFAWRNAEPVTCAEFLGDVAHCMADLPDAPYLINLCTDRYRFSVAFFAAAVRGQTTLLPSQRNVESIAALRQSYAPCRIIADSPDTHCDELVDFTPGKNGDHAELVIAPEHIAAVAFTSGSTGAPQAHAKSWRLLCAGRATHARYLAQSIGSRPTIHSNAMGLVATVPSWHMYGLEWAMMLPTVAPFTLYCGPDFFPGDVISALNNFSPTHTFNSSILVSTPVHLKALLKSPGPENQLARTLSATAPMDAVTASKIEAHLDTTMFEVYGCSEIGSLAVRNPAQSQKNGGLSNSSEQQSGWDFFDIFNTTLTGDQLQIKTPLLADAVTLADRFGALEDNRLQLLGRATDLVKVAGKRESLAHLNNELLALDGVDDGIIYQPETLGIVGGERLAAFVVGNNLDSGVIRQTLASRLDAAFVPRPIRIVEALPRDNTSKLKVSALKALAESFTDA